MSIHVPVLLEETVDLLITNKSGNYFDGTVGFGGHAEEIIKRLGEGSKYIATDKDINAINYCKEKFKNYPFTKFYNTSFTNIDSISKIEFIDSYEGIFADLGVSSFQLDETDAGFTYRDDAPLDLRMDKTQGVSASHVVNTYNEEDLAEIFFKYGEEKKSRAIAKRIVESRRSFRIERTVDLKKIIEEVVPSLHLKKTLSRIFQSLRIHLNNELGELKEFLEKSVDLMGGGSSLVIISYHSLEDRVVKDFIKYESQDCVCPPEFPVCVCNKKQRLEILTKKPITPSIEEVEQNKRSRSAKLRAARRV
ncbi:MAG: 16S rRNA (cytosine(1402)-N(4))-methyltransferase [Ignavibacteria bacterium RBG_13_36_8]|nr:MAG: 16S rRNA (cytosine(1402)-N(4))-methyltransferase [Ignavibacteria bacterium RBG_13_36_8]